MDEIIFDIAESQKDEHYRELYSVLPGSYLYLPVDLSTLPKSAKLGEQYIVQSGDKITIRKILGPQNKEFVSLATNEEHASVKGGAIQLEAIEALKMTMKIEDVHGVLLQSKTSFVGFDKQWVRRLLQELEV